MTTLRAALPAVLLLALALPGPGAAEDTCEYVRSSQAQVFLLRLDLVEQKCTWYDLKLAAWTTERIDRYEAHPAEGTGTEPVLTYYEQALERRFDDGRATFLHRTYLLAGGAFLQHDYVEARDASGRRSCHGAGELDPPIVPGRLSVPRTPPYPACAPPGLLA